MKKYIAFLLAALMLASVSCSSGDEGTVGEDVPETEASAAETVPAEEETEEEKPKYERPADEEVIDYVTLELEKDAVYDRAAGILLMYFTDHEILYPADARCSVGLISDEEAVSVSGKPDFTAYPDVQVDEDDFCGIAIKLDGEISAGEYLASVTFDRYIVSFDFNVQ